MTIPQLFVEAPLIVGMKQLFKELSLAITPNQSINVYLAGGMAVHLYTANRVTTDVDAEFGRRILIPADLTVHVKSEDGLDQILYFDTNYNSTFALMHENYTDDAIPVDLGVNGFNVKVLSPTDLVVSKISRFATHDKEDIESLLRAGLTTSKEIEKRAEEAISGYVGNTSMLRINLRDTLDLARKIENEKNAILTCRKP